MAATTMAFASPVQAADDSRRKAALSLLEVAKFYYQSGKFLKAAKGFHEAYAIDPRPEFLFNAARAEHLGMDLQAARTHYKQCLALKAPNAKLNQRARLYLGQVEATLAMVEKARRTAPRKPAERPKSRPESALTSTSPRRAGSRAWPTSSPRR